MAHKKSSDDIDLSLTGSQISARSSSRPLSAGQMKRPNSLGDVRKTKMVMESKGSRREERAQAETTNVSLSLAPHQRIASASATGNAAMLAHNGSLQNDFMALFDSATKPKIKQPASSASSTSRSKKLSSNAVKVLWQESPLKSQKTTVYPPECHVGAAESDRSEGPHNIFRPDVAMSSSEDDDLDNIEETLSQSINKLQNLQSQLSGINKNNFADDEPVSGASSHRSSRTTVKDSSREVTPRNVPTSESREFRSNSLANNMTSQGQNQRAKASLSSFEKSYQNIKHKTPVNQVKKTPVLSASATQTVAEEYINKLNLAATKIQNWFLRHRTRRLAAEAAVQRLLQQKRAEREDILKMSVAAAVDDTHKTQDKKRFKEEKARQARQEAIQELRRKREEKRNEVKRKAEEELQFLQANGRITKTPANSNLGAKTKISESKNDTVAKHSHNSFSEKTTPRVAAVGAEAVVAAGNADLCQTDLQAALPLEESDRVAPADGKGDPGTLVATRTTLSDLYDTLRKLEEEEHFLTQRSEKRTSLLDKLEKDEQESKGSNLTAENLEKLNAAKEQLSKSGSLTDDKLKSIMSFLHEVQVSDRLSEIDAEIHRMNEELEKPALLVPSPDEILQMEKAQTMASEVTNTVLSQRLELEEKGRTVSMLQKALNQQRELTVRHAKETEKEMKRRLDFQKEEYEEAVKRHLSFIDQLIDDKKVLSEKCEQLVKELKTVDRKYQDKIKSVEESHAIEITKLKEIQAAAEKLRREKWIDEKTKKIKEMTVKGLEPEIQRLIAKHKAELKKVKHVHEAELLEADERAAQRYVKMTEELRDQLAKEKEAACAREREIAKERYEKQLQQEEEAFQQQRRRLYSEVQDEKDRIATNASRQRQELDSLRHQLEDTHRQALTAMKEEFEKAREEQERRHLAEVRGLQERLQLEKEAWEENYKKKHSTWLAQKERELKEQAHHERDKEIELVITRLEEDACAAREEIDKSSEAKIRRLREKFEAETRELENSERRAVQKYNEIKARATEVEGENERLKVIIKQKDEEIRDTKKVLHKMSEERGHVSDIIRQEFADRIVATEEENKRIKNEIAELRAKHRIELDRAKAEIEEIKKAKDEEMEEVHKRVKQAIVKKEEVVSQLRQQYQAACKRADHLEGLLDQQRKHLLKK
ncbi:hypothetical protein C0Q70_00211 [Pomacea canaliculata]|uniref:Centrosomal protein of 131 kDa n=1 Tax=Pomacea canaliculata TaxID=400727 RepID=A0A2T7PW04_POMCA|nr:centrosomal protein of 131 kDa-like [Pomacea canaliculata]XP_025095825.1 centrosomal protein of 131 kDa-like [Pomacea canaliculata]XP_025095836.1 centrosomal protein of 131 kDa-like [Pomacea canaliculata]PVD37615.1 hypothetical protein C0Q70_00211 [Pomacea canaliculata]